MKNHCHQVSLCKFDLGKINVSLVKLFGKILKGIQWMLAGDVVLYLVGKEREWEVWNKLINKQISEATC